MGRGVQLFISSGPGLGDDFSHIISEAAANFFQLLP